MGIEFGRSRETGEKPQTPDVDIERARFREAALMTPASELKTGTPGLGEAGAPREDRDIGTSTPFSQSMPTLEPSPALQAPPIPMGTRPTASQAIDFAAEIVDTLRNASVGSYAFTRALSDLSALGDKADAALPVIIDRLDTASGVDRHRIHSTLLKHEPASGRAALAVLSNSTDDSKQLAALEYVSLDGLTPAGSVSVLDSAKGNPNIGPETLHKVIELVRSRPDSVIGIVSAMQGAESPEVRASALFALDYEIEPSDPVRVRSALMATLPFLRDGEEGVRAQAAHTVHRLVKDLLDAKNPATAEIGSVVAALGKETSPEVTAPLVRTLVDCALSDSLPLEYRGKLVKEAGAAYVRHGESAGQLLAELGMHLSKDPGLRAAALSAPGPTEPLDTLLVLLTDPARPGYEKTAILPLLTAHGASVSAEGGRLASLLNPADPRLALATLETLAALGTLPTELKEPLGVLVARNEPLGRFGKLLRREKNLTEESPAIVTTGKALLALE